jgi:hypothetical protein
VAPGTNLAAVHKGQNPMVHEIMPWNSSCSDSHIYLHFYCHLLKRVNTGLFDALVINGFEFKFELETKFEFEYEAKA